MKTALLLTATTGASLAFVFAPHCRRMAESFKPRTLGGIYWDILSDLPSRWNGERVILFLLLLAGVLASSLPVVLTMMLRWRAPTTGEAGGVAYGVIGLVAGIGAVANGMFIVLNQTSFAFGGRPLPGETVAFAWGLTTVQLLFAMASVAVAVSARCASFVP